MEIFEVSDSVKELVNAIINKAIDLGIEVEIVKEKEEQIMSEDLYKFVDYDIYCPKCKHCDVPEEDDPCDECMTWPINLNSSKPLNFEER